MLNVSVITPETGPVSAPLVVLEIETVAVSLSVIVMEGGGAEEADTPPPLGVMVEGAQKWVPSTIASSIAVTTTVCGVFQLALVKVSVEGAKVHCGLAPMVIVAVALGTAFKTTVNAPVAPPSVAPGVVTAVVKPEKP